jgi:hypothetical protein
VAATADRCTLADAGLGPAHSAALTITAFEQFAQAVWLELNTLGPLLVTRVEDLPQHVQDHLFLDSAAAARWEIPGADRLGIPRVGPLSGTTGPVAYIDVKDEGLNRLVALHEIAHLKVDTMAEAKAHRAEWATVYGTLLEQHLGRRTSAVWSVYFEWWTEKAGEKIQRDPNWLGESLYARGL